MSDPESPPWIAVVIATRNRGSLLAERSLPSVVAQTRSPDFLVVVDDSSPELRPGNADFVASLELPGCEVAYLENGRSQGASGSWNTALYFLLARVDDPRELFVAVLDDDDAWSPTYLQECYAAACDRQLDMIAADLRRIESVDGPSPITEGPAKLCAEDFLTTNPGIQGSNLFLRLSVFLAAGGFDEALRSTTDRDLCIRIADLGTVRYGRLPIARVDHFADPHRSRLSTRGSAAKLDGLTAFWRKHVGRMSGDQRRAFTDRAAALFDWSAPPGPAVPEDPVSRDANRIALVLGLVASNDRPGELLESVRVLAACRDSALVGLDVVLFEHGARREHPALLDVAAAALRDAGAGCFSFTLEQQARTPASLSVCCSVVAQARTGAEVWIADTRGHLDELRGERISDILPWLGAKRGDGLRILADVPGPEQWARTLEQWVQRERVATARHRVKRRFSLEHLRVLGSGSESVVFTDEHTVFKCIDYWKSRMPRSRLDFLQKQVGRWAGIPGLHALREVAEDGPWAVLTYDYEASTPYRGGHEQDLIALMNGCRSAGIVCNNIHPKNLVVTESEVKLIDYGSDIRPWSRRGFELMARRAFLTCRHAAHPELRLLMRRALTDARLPELAGYDRFRAQLMDHPPVQHRPSMGTPAKAPAHQPLALYVGIITSDPAMVVPLLRGLESLQKDPGIERLVIVILDNASPPVELARTIRDARQLGLEVAVVSVDQQRRDAAMGAFGAALRQRPDGQVGIAHARTMLQRYLGELLVREPGAFGWLLDDDMRIDDRARSYLSWLPAFRDQGVDVVIGAYEGSSPNPPLNGLRGQLVDLFHNLIWLRRLPAEAELPDRSAENAALRARFPDYYYDLSRKHTAHLEMPHWLEPTTQGETVAQAYSRLLTDALGVLTGAPLTRPILTAPSPTPLQDARDSVNRGGITFVLNPRALTHTPNTITRVHGREARRSDMLWAIVNRHYRRMTIKAVDFPVHHVGRVFGEPKFNLDKVQGELVGAALYGGLTDFLARAPEHRLDFAAHEILEIRSLAQRHLERRLRALEQSFYRIAGLGEALRRIATSGELDGLLAYLDRFFTRARFLSLQSSVQSHFGADIESFLTSLRPVADDYAATFVDTEFIQAQLRAGSDT